MQAATAADAGPINRSKALDESLARAHQLALAQSHAAVTLEHLLFALLDDPDGVAILGSSGIARDKLAADASAYIGRLSETMPVGSGASPQPGPDLLRILQLAAMAARQSQRRLMDGAIVLAAIIGDGNSPAAGMLKAQGLTFDAVIKVLSQIGQPRQAEVAVEPARVPLAPPTAMANGGVAEPLATYPTPTPRMGRVPDLPPADDLLASVRARVKQSEPAAQPVKASTAKRPVAAQPPAPSATESPTFDPPAHADQPVAAVPVDAGLATAPPEHRPHAIPVPAPIPAPGAAAAAKKPPAERAGPVLSELRRPANAVSPPAVAPPPLRGPSPAETPPLSSNLPDGLSLRAPAEHGGSRPPLPPMSPTVSAPLPAPTSTQPPPPPLTEPHIQMPPLAPALQAQTQAPGDQRYAAAQAVPAPAPPRLPTQLPQQAVQAQAPYAPLPHAQPPYRSPAQPVAPNQAPLQPLMPAVELDIVAAAAGLPATMRIGTPVLVEVRVPRDQIDVPRRRNSIDHGTPAEVPVYRVVSVRLGTGGVSGLAIEPRSPETVWLGMGRDLDANDFIWQYVVTPTRAGRFAVTLSIAGRTVSPYGVAGDGTPMIETFAVVVKRPSGARLKRLLLGLALFASGAAGAAFAGAPLIAVVKSFLSRLLT